MLVVDRPQMLGGGRSGLSAVGRCGARRASHGTSRVASRVAGQGQEALSPGPRHPVASDMQRSLHHIIDSTAEYHVRNMISGQREERLGLYACTDLTHRGDIDPYSRPSSPGPLRIQPLLPFTRVAESRYTTWMSDTVTQKKAHD